MAWDWIRRRRRAIAVASAILIAASAGCSRRRALEPEPVATISQPRPNIPFARDRDEAASRGESTLPSQPSSAQPAPAPSSSLAALQRGISSRSRPASASARNFSPQPDRDSLSSIARPVPTADTDAEQGAPNPDEVAAAIAALKGESANAQELPQQGGAIDPTTHDALIQANASVSSTAESGANAAQKMDANEADPELDEALGMFARPARAAEPAADVAATTSAPAVEDFPRTPHYRTSSRDSASAPPAKRSKGKTWWQRLIKSKPLGDQETAQAIAADSPAVEEESEETLTEDGFEGEPFAVAAVASDEPAATAPVEIEPTLVDEE